MNEHLAISGESHPDDTGARSSKLESINSVPSYSDLKPEDTSKNELYVPSIVLPNFSAAVVTHMKFSQPIA